MRHPKCGKRLFNSLRNISEFLLYLVMNTKIPGKSNRAIVALVCGAVAIAFAPIFVRVSETGPVATAFWRIFLALPFFWIGKTVHSMKYPGDVPPVSRRDIPRLMLPGVFFAADLAVWHWSIKFTTVANATLLANFAPIFVTLGAFLLFHQHITRMFLGGMVTAIAGACLLIGVSFSLSMRNLTGDILGIITAVFYASYILSIKDLRSRFTTLTIMAFAGISCSVLLLPISLISGEKFLAITPTGWLCLLGLAIVCQVMGQGLIAHALAHLPAHFSSVTLLVQPMTAAFLAWVLLNEGMNALQAVGGIIVIVGIYFARRGSQ
jgi:drug/metabolite transporter (DMT)-like permease